MRSIFKLFNLAGVIYNLVNLFVFFVQRMREGFNCRRHRWHIGFEKQNNRFQVAEADYTFTTPYLISMLA